AYPFAPALPIAHSTNSDQMPPARTVRANHQRFAHREKPKLRGRARQRKKETARQNPKSALVDRARRKPTRPRAVYYYYGAGSVGPRSLSFLRPASFDRASVVDRPFGRRQRPVSPGRNRRGSRAGSRPQKNRPLVH